MGIALGQGDPGRRLRKAQVLHLGQALIREGSPPVFWRLSAGVAWGFESMEVQKLS